MFGATGEGAGRFEPQETSRLELKLPRTKNHTQICQLSRNIFRELLQIFERHIDLIADALKQSKFVELNQAGLVIH